MRGDDDAIVAYRDAIAGRLAVLRDDGELIDALLVADAALDDLLAEVVAAECCLRTA
jgi:hypothetical protein